MKALKLYIQNNPMYAVAFVFALALLIVSIRLNATWGIVLMGVTLGVILGGGIVDSRKKFKIRK